MRQHSNKFFKAAFMAAIMILGISQAMAADSMAPKHRIVIQVSSSSPKTQNLAINNVVNLVKHYGIDNVKVELVAYGPGLSILTPKSKQEKRIESLEMSNVRFSACHNTMEAIKRKTGKLPTLIKGVKVVSGGVVRISELQEQGYSYIRP